VTGKYPFGGVKLDRADIEWLLVTHQDGNWLRQGITSRNVGTKLKIRQGLDLRGAVLSGVDLRRLPLTQLRGGLSSEEWRASTEEGREAGAIHLEGANLSRADLVEAELRSAHLEGANLSHVRLDGASLRGAHLGATDPNSPPTDLRYAYFDRASTLDNVVEAGRKPGYFCLADIRWGEVNLSVVDWQLVTMLGDELVARKRLAAPGQRKSKAQRVSEFATAVRAYRQLAAQLRNQGLNEAADRFAYRAQVLQRQVLRRQGIRKVLTFYGSLLLDLMSGYGYKPLRSFAAYLLVVIGFATVYLAIGSSGVHVLSWNEALIVSLTAFHGRGFFATAFQPGDPQAAVAAGEAVLGLLIEITFIATFTQRFFSR
jgi:hypothetical protein